MIKSENQRIILLRKDSIWLMHYPDNYLKTKQDSCDLKQHEEERYQCHRKKGIAKKILYAAEIRLEEKWLEEKIKRANSYNDSIRKVIWSLPEKYNISQIRKKGTFFPENDADKKNIELYEVEKENQFKKLIIVPDYTTKKYSVFLIDNHGFGWIIQPSEVSNEVSGTEEKVKKFLIANY